jgi:peptidoglycan-associated lipoprotein
MNRRIVSIVMTAATGALLSGACATSKTVDQKIAEAQSRSDKKIDSVETQVESLQQGQKSLQDHQAATDVKVDQLSREASDALKRAQEAGVLAKGKVVFEQTFSEDRIRFKSGSYELSSTARTALDDFGAKLKALNEQYFVEIQGHTDDVGGSRYNDNLGQQRADAVRRYLGRQQHIALNRMSTISYGDTLPVGKNKTKAGRAQNRRVVVVVLE